MGYIPPAYLEPVGDPEFPRWVFRDSGGQYFTPSGTWSAYPGEAALYYTMADAVADKMRFVDGEQLRDTYTVKIVLITDRDAWTREELVEYLTRFAATVIHKNQEKRGVVIETHWDDLHKTE